VNNEEHNNDNNQKGSGLQKTANLALKAKKAMETIKKSKIALAIVSAVGPVLVWVIIAVFVIIMFMVPIMYISEKTEQVADTLDKFINFITLKGWSTSEQVFFTTLEKEYNKFDAFNYKEGEFDIPLIASTIHYSTIVDPDSYSYDKDDKNTKYEYDYVDPVIPSNQLRSFYVVSNDKLGSAFTLVWGEKKLIGHLIDTKFKTTCVNVPTGWDIFNPDAWKDLTGTASAILEDFWSHFKYTTGDTVKSAISRGNAFKLIQLLYSYNKQGESYLGSQISNLYHEAAYDNFISDLIRIIEQSDLSSNCMEGQIPMPVITKFINYELYKDYLRNTYLKNQSYAKCEKCEYAGATDQQKKVIIERMIIEIFDQKEAYQHLQGKRMNNQYIDYIPGMSTLPIQVAPGSDWRAKTSRLYQKGTAKCFKNGVWTGKSNCDHNGIDFAYPTGTPVLAIADGQVLEAAYNSGGYGLYVKLGHDTDGDGKFNYYSLYSHLSVLNVAKNSMVGGGQEIGKVGSTGNSSGPHLHFEIRNDKDQKIDPAPILDGIMTGTGNPLNPMSKAITCGMYNHDQLAAREQILAKKVNTAGFGTREGVVAAARYLSTEIDSKIPYWWGGKSTKVGLNSQWGCGKAITASPGTSVQPYNSVHPFGLDCSGFVSWSIRNGGYKASTIEEGSSNQFNFTNNNIRWGATGIDTVKPGDLAWTDGHIGVIIGIDKTKCSYTVAEEKGASFGLVVTNNDCTSGRFSHIILMDDYYNNSSNKEV